MKDYNGIKLDYIGQTRDNYMSFPDLLQDLTTETLINILPTIEKFSKQMDIMREIEVRKELEQDYYFELLETCNGI